MNAVYKNVNTRHIVFDAGNACPFCRDICIEKDKHKRWPSCVGDNDDEGGGGGGGRETPSSLAMESEGDGESL